MGGYRAPLRVAGALAGGLCAAAWAVACSSSSTNVGGGGVVLGSPDSATAAEASVASPHDGGTDGGACLGDALALLDGGAVGDLVRSGAIDCGSVPAGCQASCARIVQNYRAGVALVAVQCMRDGCVNGDDVVPCVDRALVSACSSSTAPAYCAPLTAACVDEVGDAAPAQSTFPERGCEHFAGAFTDAGRAELAACIERVTPDGGCPRGAADCADRIRQ